MHRIIALWNRGCLGKAIIGIVGLLLASCIIGLVAPRAQPPAAVPVVPTEVPSAAPANPQPTAAQTSTEVPAPTSTPFPTPTTRVPLTGSEALNRTATAEAHFAAKPTTTPVSTAEMRATFVPEPTAATAPAPVDFDRNGDGKVTCADFDTQAEAKVALAAGYTKLDRNGDGIPCETLP